MLSKDIITYSKIRNELRAYMCYLFEQNIQNHMPSQTLQKVLEGVERIKDEIKVFDAIFVLDANGNQISENIGKTPHIAHEENVNYSDKAYFYTTIREGRTILTNPYPTQNGGMLVVTAAYPVYNQKDELLFVVCVDIQLKDAINISSPSQLFEGFSKINAIVYFILSVLLGLIAILLIIKGMASFWQAIWHFRQFDIKEIFESTILLTLALAIVDLVKAIFEEEVLGRNVGGDNNRTVHRTMIRFLGSIIIALAIEALMLVFKFTISEPDKILYAVYLTCGVAVLLIGLAIYVKFAYGAREKDRQNRC